MSAEKLISKKLLSALTTRLSVINAPFNGGQPKPGTELGPSLVHKTGVFNEIISKHKSRFDVVELNFDKYNEKKNIFNCSAASKMISDSVAEHSKKNSFVLTIGGDHSIGTGTVAGMLRTYKDLCVIWIDAHADINSYELSESKNVHGMPLSFLVDEKDMKDDCHSAYGWVQEQNMLASDRLAFIGLRDVDEAEKKILSKYNIAAYDMKLVRSLGISEAIKQALLRIDPANNRPIHVSFDVDSLDPLYTPSTGTPVSNGLTLTDAIQICKLLRSTERLVGFDIVEINPQIGTSSDVDKTIDSSKIVLDALLSNDQQ